MASWLAAASLAGVKIGEREHAAQMVYKSTFRKVLTGKEPFEFRVVEEPPTLGFLKANLDSRVLDFLGVN